MILKDRLLAFTTYYSSVTKERRFAICTLQFGHFRHVFRSFSAQISVKSLQRKKAMPYRFRALHPQVFGRRPTGERQIRRISDAFPMYLVLTICKAKRTFMYHFDKTASWRRLHFIPSQKPLHLFVRRHNDAIISQLPKVKPLFLCSFPSFS